MAHPPPIDIEGFRAMMKEAGIEEAVGETLAIYADEAPPAFDRLRASLEAGALDRAAAAAHALKSSSSNVWATGLVALLDALEHVARKGDAIGAAALFADVAPVFEEVMARVRAELP